MSARPTRRTFAMIAATTLVAAGLPIAMGAAASADTSNQGFCSGSAIWDLDVEHDDGGYDVDFEVDSNQPGQRWKLQLWHNGTRYLSEVRVTDDEGEADVDSWRSDTSGRDKFKAKGVNRATGEVCRATIVRS